MPRGKGYRRIRVAKRDVDIVDKEEEETICPRRGTGQRQRVRRWPTSEITGRSRKLVLPAESPTKKFVLVVGDSHLRSIVDGFVQMPEGCISFGMMCTHGASAAELTTELANVAVTMTPEAVLLVAPSNNMSSNRPLSEAAADFQKLVFCACSRWSKVVVLDFPPQLNIDVARQDLFRQEYKCISARMGVNYFSIAERFPLHRLDLWGRDGVHLSDNEGMQILAQLIWEAAYVELETRSTEPQMSPRTSPSVDRPFPRVVVKGEEIESWSRNPYDWNVVGRHKTMNCEASDVMNPIQFSSSVLESMDQIVPADLSSPVHAIEPKDKKIPDVRHYQTRGKAKRESSAQQIPMTTSQKRVCTNRRKAAPQEKEVLSVAVTEVIQPSSQEKLGYYNMVECTSEEDEMLQESCSPTPRKDADEQPCDVDNCIAVGSLDKGDAQPTRGLYLDVTEHRGDCEAAADCVWTMSSSASSLYFSQDSVTRFKKRKARFSFSEVHILLDEVRKHRMVVVGKFNRGVPTDVKKHTWAEITARVNEIGECQREVIEVIKKWSDLKCDTKRKVAAMRSGTVPNRGLNSRLSRDLNQTEKIVLQILEMDEEDQNMGDFGPLGDDDVPEEEEEMEEEDMMGMQNSPNGALDMSSMPPPASYSVSGLAQSGDSSQPSFDVQYEIPATEDTEAAFADSDDDQRDDVLPSTQVAKSTEDHLGNNGIEKQGRPLSPSGPSSSTGTPLLPGPPPQNTRDNILHSASLSLQEQHATNILLETVSRSLELLSESVQQLAETQQEFVRESLQLQRETVQVLRDFTGGAIALMHDKLNGRPAL